MRPSAARNVPKGRLELLEWINQFLTADYTKIEQCSDGIAYCQIFDAVFQGRVPLHKINYNPRFATEREANLSILQKVFKREGVSRNVPIERLAKGKFQDNNTFLQWCHTYINKNCPNIVHNYDGMKRRKEAIRRQKEIKKIKGNIKIKQELLPSHVIYETEEHKGSKHPFNLNQQRKPSTENIRANQSETQRGTKSEPRFPLPVEYNPKLHSLELQDPVSLLRKALRIDNIEETENKHNLNHSEHPSQQYSIQQQPKVPSSSQKMSKQKEELERLFKALEDSLAKQIEAKESHNEQLQKLSEERDFYFHKLEKLAYLCDSNSSEFESARDVQQIILRRNADIFES
eukprot:gb/GECH01010418.1/.p1 GENE.gb/GECH01010418.1/~~gb/GECH01010418.1/.p1  ORF type:complete len:346 (+),score=95.42 gb/GECH01010418.1/:1-1038(+)